MQNYKNWPIWPKPFLIELSEVPNSFVKIGLVLVIKVVLSWKHVEELILRGSTNCNCHFYTNFAVFKVEVCGKLFKHYLQENETLHTLIFYENESLQHYLLYDMRQIAEFYSLKQVRFLGSLYFSRSRVWVQVRLLDDVSSIKYGGIETFWLLGHILVWEYWNIFLDKIFWVKMFKSI